MLPVDPNRSRVAEEPSSSVLLAGIVTLLLYSFGVGLALIAGQIAPAAAYLWMSGVPVALATWYGVGFFRHNAALRDRGLLVSAFGWLMVAFCLWALHIAAQNAMRAGLRLDQMTPTPLSWIFAALAIAGIVAGAFLSWQHWQSESA